MSDRRKVLELFEKQKEATDKRVAEGIEKYRKGDGKIKLVDKNGTPISNAVIKLTQKSHEFKFGANLFMLDELETEGKNEAYKKYFADVFNMATLPFYWKDNEPAEGQFRFDKNSPRIYRRPPIDLCIEYCEAHGIEPREHCLNYETFIPDWVNRESTADIKEKLERRMQILSERYSKAIPCWEVTNETLFNWSWKKPSAFYHQKDFVEWSFFTAEKYFKDNVLAINDAHCNIFNRNFNYDRSAYYMLIERALSRGARIDAIGMQFHMFYTPAEEYEETRCYYDPSNIFAVMDTYSDFGKPLQITEITLPSYTADKEDEEIQAKILENMYSIWFSHPNMEQIIYWNLVDGYAYGAEPGDMMGDENFYRGGLLRFDLSPKPAYLKLKELVKEKWHTEAEVVTDADGYTDFRGFYGEYEAKIDSGKGSAVKSVSLLKNKDNSHTLII